MWETRSRDSNLPLDRRRWTAAVSAARPVEQRRANFFQPTAQPAGARPSAALAPFTVYTTLGEIGHPTEMFVFGHEDINSIDDGYFAIDLDPVNNGLWTNSNRPAAMHNNGTAFSFADGHVELHRWDTLAAGGTIAVMRPNGVTDVNWFKAHTSE